MSPETRKELDRIDAFLANQPSVVARELWNILTALRGPDNRNDALKDETTCVIRTKAFPQLANSFFSGDKTGAVFAMSDTLPKYLNNLQLPLHVSYHFAIHVNRAYSVLDISPKEENSVNENTD